MPAKLKLLRARSAAEGESPWPRGSALAAGSQPLYEGVAARLQAMIEGRTLRPGDRIPSVRRLHRQWSVSVSTVLHAYRLLEARGLIEARPQSGYYVRAGIKPHQKLRALPPSKEASEAAVEVRSLAVRLSENASRDDFVKLGCALPDPSFMPTLELGRLLSKVARHKAESHGYSLVPGHPRLRRELAARLLDSACILRPDELVITHGAQEAVYLALRAVTSPGDAVVVESPTYFGLLEVLAALGLRAIEVRTDPRSGIDLGHLRQVLRQGEVRACALSANFGNPLGHLMPNAHKAELVALLNSLEIPIVEDDVYGELGFEVARPSTLKSFDRAGLVLYCASVSKTLSPGLRVGWVAPGRFRDKVVQLKVASSVGGSVLPELALAEYLASGRFDRHLRRLRRSYSARVDAMRLRVAECFPEGVKVSQPQGGHVLWVELPSKVDGLQIHQQAAEQQISVAPGVMFSPTGRFSNYLRLNCAVPATPTLDRALTTLGELIARALES